ncbi:FadR/GntR family transcriptional regulator [Pseudoduganella buxea]|uniref:FCD domain-containing protein n=1 Tax=Pseudoduganella buxea TaxID=1949069 RepID=A0A6I3SVL3_9BURK|nr:FadR/GntR family transcriptional regulator [Pseudoduganella buxea]MTV51817.1 FCD domain-containing protein [Pseudoduganella buxea]GGB98979.1 GntR family transcriptional regulator [Pseudoduganella buxea]
MQKRSAPMPETATHEPRLYRIVADRIGQLIAAEGLLPGARLPSERDLATRLAVSRASLREALIALELGGVIEVRGGSGVYVSEMPQARAPLPEAEAGPGPFEVLSARRLIEGEIAAMAARTASDSAIDAILKAVEEMETHHANKTTNEQADRNFHMAIGRATGNGAMAGTLEYLWDQRGRLWHKLKEHFQTEELRQETLKDHRRIFEAIAAHDPAAARKAMRSHLERVTRTFSRG